MQPSYTQLLQLAIIPGIFALSGALIGALFSGYFNLHAKRAEYVNDYYKRVIDRRIAAYEQLERLIISMKTAVLDADKKPYHLIFSQDESGRLLPAYQILHETTAHALWLSDAAFDATREFNRLLSTFERSAMTPVEFGKENYANVAGMREMIERILANDMLTLHEVHRFLRSKKTRPDLGLEPWH